MTINEEIRIKQKAQEYFEKDLSYNQVYKQGVIDGYNKAIDDFIDMAYRKLGLSDDWKDLDCVDIINEIANQLREPIKF